MRFQKDRQYELKVGQGNGTGILIDNLHIDFSVSKSSDNKKKPNKAMLRHRVCGFKTILEVTFFIFFELLFKF